MTSSPCADNFILKRRQRQNVNSFWQLYFATCFVKQDEDKRGNQNHFIIIAISSFFMSANKKESCLRVATIAKRIRLCLPSCIPGFESQAHHLRLYQFIIDLFYEFFLFVWCEKDENSNKRPRLAHLKNNHCHQWIFCAIT